MFMRANVCDNWKTFKTACELKIKFKLFLYEPMPTPNAMFLYLKIQIHPNKTTIYSLIIYDRPWTVLKYANEKDKHIRVMSAQTNMHQIYQDNDWKPKFIIQLQSQDLLQQVIHGESKSCISYLVYHYWVELELYMYIVDLWNVGLYSFCQNVEIKSLSVRDGPLLINFLFIRNDLDKGG